MLISIVIPTYNEENIYKTLRKLAEQTIFDLYKNQVEIVISDYDPEKTGLTTKGWEEFIKDYPSILLKVHWVYRKGIAYARHEGIVASFGQIIVNFDADARFSTNDALEKLVQPIINNECVMTCCDNLLDADELEPQHHFNETIILVKAAYATTDMIQKDNQVVTLEPGMCFTRHVYDFVGGFNDIKQSEAFFLSLRIIYNFGFNCKKHVPDIAVLVSPRRAIASTKLGIIDTWFNYDNAFRLSNNKNLDSHKL